MVVIREQATSYTIRHLLRDYYTRTHAPRSMCLCTPVCCHLCVLVKVTRVQRTCTRYTSSVGIYLMERWNRRSLNGNIGSWIVSTIDNMYNESPTFTRIIKITLRKNSYRSTKISQLLCRIFSTVF